MFIVGGILLYILNPTEYKLMPKCVFKLITGLDCPGCGFQRAVHALLHGRISEAMNYNLFLTFFGVPYLIADTYAKLFLSGERQLKALAVLEGKTMMIIYIIAFTLWFIVRNILHI